MSKTARSEEILRIVNSEGSISICELSRRVYASRSTVRRDLERLEARGMLRRHHGGAESILELHPPKLIRHSHNQNEKRIIGEKAARLILPGSTVFIDASTTAQYIIPHISANDRLTVYTNGADTAIRLAEANIRAICTGGELFAQSMAYVGAAAAEAVQKIRFDAMFFSSAGIDREAVSDWSESETVLRRAVMRQSAKKYLLADSSKRGKSYTHIVCLLSELDDIIME